MDYGCRECLAVNKTPMVTKHMDQITFLLREVQNESGMPEQAFASFKQVIDSHQQRMLKAFPNYNLFTTGTGQSYGLQIQQRIIDSFHDLTKHTKGSDYDAVHLDQRIEIKSLKALKGASSDYIGARIRNASSKTDEKLSGSFQQVKPAACEWFLFHILYGNAERLFLVPSKIFSATPKKENKEPGRILLSAQHRGHSTEGQANVGQILSRAGYFSFPGEYSSGIPNAYSFADFKKEIVSRLDVFGPEWHLPEA